MIFFLRHAHREVVDRSEDNGLSEKGVRQCERLKKYFLKKNISFSELRTSPKLRCRETLSLLAPLWPSKKIQEEWALLEQEAHEGAREFRERVLSFLDKLSKNSKPVLLCTHGDFLDVVLRWGSQSGEIKKGDLLVWDPAQNNWQINPVRAEEGSLGPT